MNISALIGEMKAKISDPSHATNILKKVKQYDALEESEQLRKFPSVYLMLEQYLTEIDPKQPTSRKRLRSYISEHYEELLKYEHIKLIFEDREQQEILMSRGFLKEVIESLSDILGKKNHFSTSFEWLSGIPNNADQAIPLEGVKTYPANRYEWSQLLIHLAHKIHKKMEELIGEESVSRIFERAYKKYAELYLGLESFTFLVRLIPDKLLDEQKISLLNINQTQQVLFDKIKELDDVNETLRKRNKELLESREEAERANQLKSKFLKHMSHEIRTPMTSVLGFAELLEMNHQKPDRVLEYASVIQNNGQRLMGLINDFLDISKIESGVTQIYCNRFSLKELRQFRDTVSLQVKENVKLELSILNEDELIECDEEKLLQILINITTNSAKFTQKGSIKVEIKLEESNLIFTIRDTSEGFDEKEIDHIFEEFFKLKHEDKSYTGSGLNLSIAKKLVALLNGRIYAKSALGAGSSFHVSIPVKIVHAESDTRREKADLKLDEFKKLKDSSHYVLLAEDEESIQKLLRSYLEDYINIEIVNNGKDALEKFKEKKSPLVILDIMMPVMSGDKALKEIKKIDPKVIAIALSANAMKGDKEEFLKAGFDYVLSKPIQQEDLLAALCKCLLQIK